MAGSDISINFNSIDNVSKTINTIISQLGKLKTSVSGFKVDIETGDASKNLKSIEDTAGKLKNSLDAGKVNLDGKQAIGDLDSIINEAGKVKQSLNNAGGSVNVDTSGAVQNLQSVENEAGKVKSSLENAGSGAKALHSNISSIGTAFSGLMSLTLGKSLEEATISSNSLRETTKLLVQDLGDASLSGQQLFKNIDNYTNNALVGMDGVITATNTFKGATGASASQADKFASAASKMGTKIIAMGYSTDEANQAMLSLTRGIGGAFAALDQYGVTADSLMNTGLWTGAEEDIDGFVAALDAATGDTSKFMNTFAGQSAIAQKQFGIFMRNSSGGIFEFGKQVLAGFNQADEGTKNFIFSIIGAGSALATFGGAIAPVITTVEAVSDSFKILVNASSTLKTFVANLTGSMPKIGNAAKDISKTADDTQNVGKSLEKFNNINIQVKNNIAQIIKGAAVALVAIGAALVVLLAAAGALAVFGVAYKALEKHINNAVDGLITMVPALIILGGVAAVLAVAGTMLFALPAIIVGAAVAIIAVGVALGTLLVAGAELALFGAGFAPLQKGVEAASQALQVLTPALLQLATALLALAAVNLATAISAFSSFVLGIAGIVVEGLTGKSIITNILDQVGGVIRDITNWVQSNGDLINGGAVTVINQLNSVLQPLNEGMKQLQPSIEAIGATAGAYANMSFWQGLTGSIGGNIQGSLDLIREVMDVIKNNYEANQSVYSSASAAIASLKSILETLKPGLTGLKESITSIGAVVGEYSNLKFWQATQGTVGANITGSLALVTEVAFTVNSEWSANGQQWSMAIGTTQQLKALLDQLNPGLTGLKDTLKNIGTTISTYQELGKDSEDPSGAISSILGLITTTSFQINTQYTTNGVQWQMANTTVPVLNALLNTLNPALQMLQTALNAISATITTFASMPVGEPNSVITSILNLISWTAFEINTWYSQHFGEVTFSVAAINALNAILSPMNSALALLNSITSAIASTISNFSGIPNAAGKISQVLSQVQAVGQALQNHGITDPGNGAAVAVQKIQQRLTELQQWINSLQPIDKSQIDAVKKSVDDAKAALTSLGQSIDSYGQTKTSITNAGRAAGIAGFSFGLGTQTYSNTNTYTIKTENSFQFDDIGVKTGSLSQIVGNMVNEHVQSNQAAITKEWFATREFTQILQQALGGRSL